MPNTDGPWTLSLVLSYLNHHYDYSLFAQSYDGPIFKWHVEQIVLSPFFKYITINRYSIFIFHLFIFLLNCFLTGVIFKKTNTSNVYFFLMAGAQITSIYFYGLRIEPVLITLVLSMILMDLTIQNFQLKLVFQSILTSIIGLIHPVGGIVAILTMIILFIINGSFNVRNILAYSFICLVCVLFLSEFSLKEYILYYLKHNQGDDHSFNLNTIFKYFLFSPVFLSLIIILLKSDKKKLKSFLIILSFVLPLLFLGRSYYFVYLYIPIVMIIANSECSKIKFKSFETGILMISILFGSVFTHFFPTYRIIENPEYSRTFNAALDYINDYGERVKSDKIWTTSQLSMEIIDQENSRLFFRFYKNMDSDGITLINKDVVIFEKAELKNDIIRNLSPGIKEYRCVEIFPEVKGLVTLSSLFQSRGPGIGLWVLEVCND